MTSARLARRATREPIESAHVGVVQAHVRVLRHRPDDSALSPATILTEHSARWVHLGPAEGAYPPRSETFHSLAADDEPVAVAYYKALHAVRARSTAKRPYANRASVPKRERISGPFPKQG